jgi:7-dehydrocholesterol reductase
MAKPKPSSAGAKSTAAAAAPAPPATVHSALVTYTSMLALLSLCPPFVILL